ATAHFLGSLCPRRLMWRKRGPILRGCQDAFPRGPPKVKPVNSLLSATGTTIFTVMSALAVQHRSINLGQGFPDTDGPDEVLRAAADALFDGRNQYPPLTGVPELREAVAAANRRFYGLEADPATEVVVTS